MPDEMHHRAKSLRVMDARRRDAHQPVGKNRRLASRVATPPAADTHAQRDRPSLRRQVLQRPPVAAMTRLGPLPTARTRRTRRTVGLHYYASAVVVTPINVKVSALGSHSRHDQDRCIVSRLPYRVGYLHR